MKKFYFLVLSLFFTVGALAQMTITQDGNTVMFTYDPSAGTLPNNSGGDLDLGSAVPNIYSWIDTADVLGGDPNYAVFGNWPGSAMTDNGDGTWSAVIDLGTLYGAGVQIIEMNWIINGNGQQTGDMLATAYGFEPVTIAVMSVNDLQASRSAVIAIGSNLYFNQSGAYSIVVYNSNGKLISNSTINAAAGQLYDLQLNYKGIYFVQVRSENNKVQSIKVIR